MKLQQGKRKLTMSFLLRSNNNKKAFASGSFEQVPLRHATRWVWAHYTKALLGPWSRLGLGRSKPGSFDLPDLVPSIKIENVCMSPKIGGCIHFDMATCVDPCIYIYIYIYVRALRVLIQLANDFSPESKTVIFKKQCTSLKNMLMWGCLWITEFFVY